MVGASISARVWQSVGVVEPYIGANGNIIFGAAVPSHRTRSRSRPERDDVGYRNRQRMGHWAQHEFPRNGQPAALPFEITSITLSGDSDVTWVEGDRHERRSNLHWGQCGRYTGASWIWHRYSVRIGSDQLHRRWWRYKWSSPVLPHQACPTVIGCPGETEPWNTGECAFLSDNCSFGKPIAWFAFIVRPSLRCVAGDTSTAFTARSGPNTFESTTSAGRSLRSLKLLSTPHMWRSGIGFHS